MSCCDVCENTYIQHAIQLKHKECFDNMFDHHLANDCTPNSCFKILSQCLYSKFEYGFDRALGAVKYDYHENGATILMLCIAVDNLDYFNKAIQYCDNINFIDPLGETLLTRSAYYSNYRFVDRLISLGADINLKNNDGDTPLAAAFSIRSLEIFTKLLAAGANIHGIQFRNESTLLDLCIQKNDYDSFEELISYGAIIPQELLLQILKENCSTKFITKALDIGVDINYQDKDGRTALMILLTADDHGREYHSYEQIYKILLNYCPDVNIQDKYGYTALMYATSTNLIIYVHTCSEGIINIMSSIQRDLTIKLIDLLLDNNANIELVGNDGQTAKTLAAKKGIDHPLFAK